MKIVRDAILFFTALILFFGSLSIIFFDNANLLHLAIFYVIAVPLLYVLYHFTDILSTTPAPSNANDKIKESIATPETGVKSTTLDEMNPPLLTIRSIFPFDIFPDEITIGERSITIVKRSFFKTGITEALPIDQITAVDVVVGPIFASVLIKQGLVPSQELQNLWKSDAVKAKTLIEELMLKRRQQK